MQTQYTPPGVTERFFHRPSSFRDPTLLVYGLPPRGQRHEELQQRLQVQHQLRHNVPESGRWHHAPHTQAQQHAPPPCG